MRRTNEGGYAPSSLRVWLRHCVQLRNCSRGSGLPKGISHAAPFAEFPDGSRHLDGTTSGFYCGSNLRRALADLRSESFDFHGAIAFLILCMTLFIQRSEHRDTQAIQAKLDELLRANSSARSGLSDLDKQEPEEIEAHRDPAKAGD
jgi:hypothetical protein